MTHKSFCSTYDQSRAPEIALDIGLERINGLHGRDELGAVLVEIVAAGVHRFAGERHHADGLR